MLQAVRPTRPWALHAAVATRQMEQTLLAQLPPHEAMARAGASVARLARALAPHARHVWIACGPGNNGGDGWVAAAELLPWAQAAGATVSVSVFGDPARLPVDARWAFERAHAQGIRPVDGPPPQVDLAIDAIWGLGSRAVAPDGSSSPVQHTDDRLWDSVRWLAQAPCTVLCVDLPSGLHPDTGRTHPALSSVGWRGQRHTLSLLTLKPGLFTADGRDAAGQVWLDDLHRPGDPMATPLLPTAWWGAPVVDPWQSDVPSHRAHKGVRGDVVVVGGQGVQTHGAGMAGAAVLAARAALHGGAGRVYWVPLDDPQSAALGWDPQAPELMLRTQERLTPELLRQATVVCGCGGGDAVRQVLPDVLTHSRRLVLDADGLNQVADAPGWQSALRQRAARGQATVITPHPLEAARLLKQSTAEVQADRLLAAGTLAESLQVVCVLKGSGTVVVAPGQPPFINGSGNGRLATAGTGDVLAGLMGAAMAGASMGNEAPPSGNAFEADFKAAYKAACAAVYAHGRGADLWHPEVDGTLTASGLVARLPSLNVDQA